MTDGPGFLEFFILEASDYVEQLDGLLLGGGSTGPDADALQRVARALRGTATMAKLPSFADLAAGVERVGRAIHHGSLTWDPALGGALVAAIDDLKTLLHAARNWSPSDDRRAAARAAELARYAPARGPAANAATTAAASSTGSYLSTEAANIAAGLELLTTRAGDQDTASNVLRRIRALRGVAGVKEIGPLADALEATEDAGRSLEGGREELTPEARRLLETAAAYLRTLASALRGGGDVNAPTPARQAFEAACAVWGDRASEHERVIPIAELFYADGSGLVEASRHPPTTASERFRLELVSHGEHLRQVVDGARRANDAASKARVQRDLRRAVHALQAAAESFGETEVAEFVRAHSHATDTIDFLGLSALDDLASIVAEPGVGGTRLRARLEEVAGGREFATAIGAGFGRSTPIATPAAPAAPIMPAPPRPSAPLSVAAVPPPPAPERPAPQPPPRRSAPAAAAAKESLDTVAASLIDSSIAALESLTSKPMIPHTPLPEEQGEIVPIESLLYRGRAALDRAVEVRDQIRRVGSDPDPDALEELFDLIELARAD